MIETPSGIGTDGDSGVSLNMSMRKIVEARLENGKTVHIPSSMVGFKEVVKFKCCFCDKELR